MIKLFNFSNIKLHHGIGHMVYIPAYIACKTQGRERVGGVGGQHCVVVMVVVTNEQMIK